jgi:hypothetical protein
MNEFWAKNAWLTTIVTIAVSGALGWSIRFVQPLDSVPGGFHVVGKAQILQVQGSGSGNNIPFPCSMSGWCDFEIHVNMVRNGQAQATLSCDNVPNKPKCIRFLADQAHASQTDAQSSGQGDNSNSVGASVTIVLQPTSPPQPKGASQ